MGRNAFFNFKKFGVQFSKKVFPVGTDSCLLGAWMCHHFKKENRPPKALDIGCGTGVLGLFAATELHANVTAIDIQPAAVEQCQENVKSNALEHKIRPLLSNIAAFNTSENFDLLVSNPPYFPDLKTIQTEREIARQTGDHFSIETFLLKASSLLTTFGKMYLVVPFDQLPTYRFTALQHELYLTHTAFVKGTESSEIKRVLLCFSKAKPNYYKQEIIVLEKDRGIYGTKATQLLSPYYLNL